MLRAVLDTNILISARRSRSGASNKLLDRVVESRFAMLVSVPLLLEYEAVLTRPAQLLASGLDLKTTVAALNYLAAYMTPVWLDFRWRPQTADPGDEMVFETAINGHADYIVTFNEKHFGSASRFGIQLVTPSDFLEKIK